jgi:calcium-dependent protein kinase
MFRIISPDDNLNANEEPTIKYTDFIRAAMDYKIYLTKEKLWSLFKYFDYTNTNSIVVEDIKEILARHGKELPED